jgi:transcriptional regulator with XRE-family HTH domain
MIARRKDLELSQQDIADALGVTRSAVSAWELGRNEPSLPDLIKLKVLFKTDDDVIFLDEKDTNRVEEPTEQEQKEVS